MRTIIIGLTAAGLLAACSGDTPKEEKAAEKVDALQPGEYEYTTKVDEVRSTDNTAPATAMKVAAAGETPPTARVCVTAEGVPPTTFAEAGDTCAPTSSYMRGGRMSLQFNCTRTGRGGLTQLVDGNFTANTFEAKVITSTYFSGPGDYSMSRTLTGRRVGDCPAAPAPGAQ